MVTASTCWACAPCAASLRHSARSRRTAGCQHPFLGIGRCPAWPVFVLPRLAPVARPCGAALATRMHRCLCINAVNVTRSTSCPGAPGDHRRLTAGAAAGCRPDRRAQPGAHDPGVHDEGCEPTRKSAACSVTGDHDGAPDGRPRNSSLTVQMHGCRSPAPRRTDAPEPMSPRRCTAGGPARAVWSEQVSCRDAAQPAGCSIQCHVISCGNQRTLSPVTALPVIGR